MSHARRAFVGGVGFTLLVAAGVACSAESASTLPTDRATGEADGGTAETTAPGAAGSADAFGAAASGVVLVHAASFPSFRLCFSGQMNLRPQPETKIMPESNVVGVETGSFVRLPPMAPPGTIYVIDETSLRDRTESCDDLFKNGIVRPGNDYDTVVGSVDQALGSGGVDVVALTGCANDVTLANLHVNPATCGAGYVSTTGNLHATITRLQATRTGVTSTQLPVQLYQLSSAVTALGASGPLTVSFGALPAPAGALGQPLHVGLQTTLRWRSRAPKSDAR